MQLTFKCTMNPADGYPIKIFQNIINHASLAILSPFLIRYDATEKKFVADSKFYRKILAAFLHIGIIGQYCLLAYERIQTKDRVQYWTKILSSIAIGLHLYSITYTIWFKQKKMMDFLNQMRALCDHLNQNGFLRIHKKIIWVLKILSPASVIIYGLISLQLPNHKSKLQAYNWTETCSVFLIMSTNETSIFGNESFSQSAYCSFLKARLILKFMQNAHIMFGFLLLFGVSLSLWLIIKDFVHILQEKSPKPEQVKYVLDALVEISKVFGSCDRTFGFMYAQTGLTLIPILAIECHQLFKENVFERIEFVADATIFATTLILAAGCNSLIKSIPIRIFQSISTDSKHFSNNYGHSLEFRSTLLMNLINADQFGISGHFFVITYEFVGT
ncbi:unnamed protein product, partial [Allacma fusca]